MRRLILALALTLAVTLLAPAAFAATSGFEGLVTSVTPDTPFALDVDGTTYTVAVSATTEYAPAGTTFADLDPGDGVEVAGTLSDTTIAATQVTLRSEDFECVSDNDSHGSCVSQAAHAAKEIEPGRERGQFVSCVARGEEDCSIPVTSAESDNEEVGSSDGKHEDAQGHDETKKHADEKHDRGQGQDEQRPDEKHGRGHDK